MAPQVVIMPKKPSLIKKLDKLKEIFINGKMLHIKLQIQVRLYFK